MVVKMGFEFRASVDFLAVYQSLDISDIAYANAIDRIRNLRYVAAVWVDHVCVIEIHTETADGAVAKRRIKGVIRSSTRILRELGCQVPKLVTRRKREPVSTTPGCNSEGLTWEEWRQAAVIAAGGAPAGVPLASARHGRRMRPAIRANEVNWRTEWMVGTDPTDMGQHSKNGAN